jgi:hypothetical protein
MGYGVTIRILEQLRKSGVTESDITLIPKRWGECDALYRSYISKAGLRNVRVDMGMGYADKGSKDLVLITIIKGEV